MKHETPIPALKITRRFDAPPDAVFAAWLDADALLDWFAPDSFTGTAATADPRPGGSWQVDFRSDTGQSFSESGHYIAIGPGHTLQMTLIQSMQPDRELMVTVTCAAAEGGTVMEFTQTGFASADQRDGMGEGWGTCLDKLARRLAPASASASAA